MNMHALSNLSQSYLSMKFQTVKFPPPPPNNNKKVEGNIYCSVSTYCCKYFRFHNRCSCAVIIIFSKVPWCSQLVACLCTDVGVGVSVTDVVLIPVLHMCQTILIIEPHSDMPYQQPVCHSEYNLLDDDVQYFCTMLLRCSMKIELSTR